jgi:GNAT superfamily N-acetyltransferase
MRASEFSDFTFDTEPYEGWTGEGLVVRAYDGKDEVGHVIFEPTEDDVTQWYAVDVEVEEPYQRRGIATAMYNIAKRAAQAQGAIIVKSHTQTDAGRGLWQDKKVWESTNNQHSPEFENAVDNWGSMWRPKENAQIILSSPEAKPFMRSPSIKNVYRAITSLKSTNSPIIPYATNIEGAKEFALSLEITGKWYIVQKVFSPQAFLLDFTNMIRHYKLVGDRDIVESEIWMKNTQYYSEYKKDEIVSTFRT